MDAPLRLKQIMVLNSPFEKMNAHFRKLSVTKRSDGGDDETLERKDPRWLLLPAVPGRGSLLTN